MNITDVMAKVELKVAFQVALKRFIFEETKRLAVDYYFERSKVSAKAETIRNIVLDKELFGCQRANVLEVLSIYMGEDLRDAADQIKWNERFPMIVFTENRNGHDYDLERPILSLGNGRGIHMDGHMGNNLDTRRRTIRPATDTEIEKFFESAPFLDVFAHLMRFWYGR